MRSIKMLHSHQFILDVLELSTFEVEVRSQPAIRAWVHRGPSRVPETLVAETIVISTGLWLNLRGRRNDQDQEFREIHAPNIGVQAGHVTEHQELSCIMNIIEGTCR